MAIAAPTTSTTAIGYIMKPPPWKKRTTMLKNCILRLPCLNQAIKLKTKAYHLPKTYFSSLAGSVIAAPAAGVTVGLAAAAAASACKLAK